MEKPLKHFMMPLTFLGALFLPFVFCHVIPVGVKSFFYAISLTIKELLIFSLPFVIFALIFSSITKLGSRAIGYIFIIAPLVCFSNFTNTMMSYFISSGTSKINITSINHDDGLRLLPMFDLEIPKIISNDITLVAGVLLGLILVICKNGLAIRLAQKFDTFTKLFFKGLTPIMPLFIAGMTMKLQHDGVLKSICEQYLPILFTFVISAFGWIFLQFFVFSGFRFSKVSEYIKNTLPAMLTALGSMSSAVALPLSIKAAEKNLIEKRNAGIIAPSVVNIHLVGDCFFIPMIALTVMVSFGMKFPTMREYILFTLHFVITKFAVAAVPGGGVIVMIPVMQNYLGLSVEMTALVTALYILFDPLITTCNVFGNASLSIIFDKITRLWRPANTRTPT